MGVEALRAYVPRGHFFGELVVPYIFSTRMRIA